jgi:putative acetyltransferase
VDNELPELKAIRSAFDRWRGEFWVLELEQRIVGCVGWTPAQSEPSAIELRKLYIHPELRRQGHGGRLCSMIEEVATRAQMAFVELWSDTRFVQAHQLYESRGYVRGPQRALHDLSNTLEFYYRKAL